MEALLNKKLKEVGVAAGQDTLELFFKDISMSV